jgi:hypothetical protein
MVAVLDKIQRGLKEKDVAKDAKTVKAYIKKMSKSKK